MFYKMFLPKAVAFIRKDFLIEISYKLSFILDFFSIFVQVVTFYFIAKLFGEGASRYLKSYGGDYFPFVLIGIAFYDYLGTSLRSFSASIRREQMMGTLEAILVTPARIPHIIISMNLWNFISASINVLIYFLFGILCFGLNLAKANFLSAFIILILTVISLSSIGIISASFIMVFKRGDPINWFMSTVFALLGGVYFPVTILPVFLQSVAYLLPITYSLRAMRCALLEGYPLRALSLEVVILLGFCVFLLPLSIFVFKYAVRKAKKDGSLVQY